LKQPASSRSLAAGVLQKRRDGARNASESSTAAPKSRTSIDIEHPGQSQTQQPFY
jgi:hypothetical protein